MSDIKDQVFEIFLHNFDSAADEYRHVTWGSVLSVDQKIRLGEKLADKERAATVKDVMEAFSLSLEKALALCEESLPSWKAPSSAALKAFVYVD